MKNRNEIASSQAATIAALKAQTASMTAAQHQRLVARVRSAQASHPSKQKAGARAKVPASGLARGKGSTALKVDSAAIYQRRRAESSNGAIFGRIPPR